MKRHLGHMRHRVTIKTIVRTGDGGGGTVRADTNGATVWARVEALSSREVAAYDQLQQRVTHRVTIRKRTDVAQGQTLAWGSVDLYVNSVRDPDQDRPGEWLELLCREGGLT